MPRAAITSAAQTASAIASCLRPKDRRDRAGVPTGTAGDTTCGDSEPSIASHGDGRAPPPQPYPDPGVRDEPPIARRISRAAENLRFRPIGADVVHV